MNKYKIGKYIIDAESPVKAMKIAKVLDSNINDSNKQIIDWVIDRGFIITVRVDTNSLLRAAKENKVVIAGGHKPTEQYLNDDRSLTFWFSQYEYPFDSRKFYISFRSGQSTIQFITGDNPVHHDFTYKMYGGRKAFDKAKLTEAVDKIRKKLVDKFKSVGVKVFQSKIEVYDYMTGTREAHTYNDSNINNTNNNITEIDYLTEEEEKAIDDYRQAIVGTNNPKLLELYKHILEEEIEHKNELQNAKTKDSVKDDKSEVYLDDKWFKAKQGFVTQLGKDEPQGVHCDIKYNSLYSSSQCDDMMRSLEKVRDIFKKWHQ